MRRLSLSTLATLSLAIGTARADIELRNDSFESGQTVVAHGGFADGDIAASRFFIAAPVRLLAVRLIFANATEPGGSPVDVTLHVWADDQTSTTPGAELFNGDFTITPSQTNMQELSVLAENVTVGGYFRVGLEVLHNGQPSVTNDTNGLSSAVNNLIKDVNFGWQTSSFFGVSGDWIIRAVVADGSGTPDAGVTIDASNGGPDASTGGPDAGTGGQCNGNGDCELGEYCDTAAHACTFDCRHDSDCPNDGECNSLGQCVGATDGGGGCCSTGRAGGDGEAALAALGLAGLVGAMVTRRRRRTADGAGSGSTRA